MIAALCILLPLVLAGLLPFVPGARWVQLGCAVVDLALAASLPWTGGSLDGWLLPDPLMVHLVVLTGFAWVMASVLEPVPGSIAVLVGLVNLALLSDGSGLTVIAAGGAGIAAVFSLRLATPGPMLALATAGTGLAVLGTAVLYVGAVPALGPGWPALSWSMLTGASDRASGAALSAGFVLILLGVGVSCLLVPIAAALCPTELPRPLAMLVGPLGGLWLAVALRLRGVLDGNGHAIAPGGVLQAAGLIALALGVLCLWRGGRLLPAAMVAIFGAVLVGFGVGGAPATAAGLLHLTLGCVALTAAATGSRLGLASLAGVPPLGVFASGFLLLADSASRGVTVAALLGLGLFSVAVLALRDLPAVVAPRLAWVGVGLALAGGWAMPPALAAWIQGIAAAAR